MADNNLRKQLFAYLQKKGVYDNEDSFNKDMDTEDGRRALYDRMYQGGAAIKWEDFDRNLRPELAQAAENRSEQAAQTAKVKPAGNSMVSGTENMSSSAAPKGNAVAATPTTNLTGKVAAPQPSDRAIEGYTADKSQASAIAPQSATGEDAKTENDSTVPSPDSLTIKSELRPDGGLNEFMEEAYWQSPQAAKLKKDTHEFFNASLIGRADEFFKYGETRAKKIKDDAFRSHNFESGYAGDLIDADVKADWAKDPQKVIDNFNKILGIRPVDSSVKNGVLTKNEKTYTVRNGYIVGTPEQEALQQFVLKQLGLPTNTVDDGTEGEKAVAPLSDEKQKEWMQMYNEKMNHVVTCIQDELRNYLVERNMPESWLDYIVSGGFKDSTLGAISSIIMDKAAKNSGFRLAMMEGLDNMTTKDFVTSEAERRYLDKLGFCSRALLSGARGATSMIIDAPVFALGGAGSATAAAKLGNWVGMKFGSKLAANVAARVVSGGMTFGGYDLIQEGIGQIAAEELDATALLSSYAKGFATGGVLGATNTAIDRAAQKMIERGSRMAAYAVHGAGYAAEVGLFTGSEVAAESAMNGEFIGWDKTFEILGKQGVLIGLLKGKGKIEQVYGRVQMAKNVNEALGLDANNLQELRDAGYDDDKVRMMVAGQRVRPTDFKPNAEVKNPADKTFFENVAEEERAELIRKMMADEAVSWDTKQKMMQALTGYIMPDVPAAAVAVSTDDKGNRQILVKDASGNVLSRKYVTDADIAGELNKAHNRVRVSQIAQMEDALMNCVTQLPSAIEQVAKDNHMSYDRIVECLRAEEQGNAEGWQTKIAEQVRNTSRTLATQQNLYEGAARIRSEVEQMTGVDLDVAMARNNPSTAQMEAMDMYISRLNEKCEELSEHNDWVNEKANATADAQRQVEAIADKLRPYADEQGKIKTAVVDGKQVYIANETDDFYFVTDGNGDAPVGVSKDKASNVTEMDFDGEMAAVSSQTVEEALGKLENRKMGLHEETPTKYTAGQPIEMGGADGKPVNAVVTGVDANGLVTYQTTNEKGEVTGVGQTDADALKRMQSEFFKARDRAKEKSEREGIVYSPEWAMAEKRKEEEAMSEAQKVWADKAVAFGRSLNTEVKLFRTLQDVIDEYGSESEQAQRCKERFNSRTGRVISPAKGWYDIDGTVGLFVPAGKSEKDMKQTILHEVVGHSGIPSLLIDGWESMDNAQRSKARAELFSELYNQLGDRQRTEVDEKATAKYGGDIVEATDEYLASTAEKDVIPSWFGKVAGAIRTGLNRKGYAAETDGDILYLLWRSRMAKMGEGDGFYGSVQDATMRLKLGIDRMRGGRQESRAEEQVPTEDATPKPEGETPKATAVSDTSETTPAEEPAEAISIDAAYPQVDKADAVGAGAVFATTTTNGTNVRMEIGSTDTDGRVELKIFTGNGDTPYVEFKTMEEVQELVSMDGVSLIRPATPTESVPVSGGTVNERTSISEPVTVSDSSESESTPVSAYDVIPTDANGRKDYTKATVDETWEALNERYGDDAKLMAEEALSMAETEAEKMKKSGDLDAYGDAFRKVKYWKGVNETVNRRIEAERQEAARKEAVDAVDNIINNGLNPDDAHVLTTFGLVEKTMREEIEHEQDPYKKQAMSDYWNSISEELMPAYNREYWNTALAMRTKGGKVSVKTVLDDLGPEVGEDMLLDLGVDLDYNLGMNASWAGFKQSNAYKIMTEENRTDIADVLDMVAAENKAKREEYRKKKEAEASRMREGEEDENKEANTTDGTGSIIAPVSERSAAVAPQTSSNTLNQSGKVLSSGLESFSLIDSGAKVRFRDEDAKEIFSKNTTDSKNKVRKAINGDKISKREFHEPVELVREIAKNVGLLRAKSTASYYKTYGIGDEAVELRISHHPLHGKNIRKSDADRAVSLVIYKDGKHEGGQEIPFEEYIHYVPDGEYAKVGEDILKGVGEFLETGKYPNYANGEKFTYSREEYEDINTRFREGDDYEKKMKVIDDYLWGGKLTLTNWELEDMEFRLKEKVSILNARMDIEYEDWLEKNGMEDSTANRFKWGDSDETRELRRILSRTEQQYYRVLDAEHKKVEDDWNRMMARPIEEDYRRMDEERGIDHKLHMRKVREGWAYRRLEKRERELLDRAYFRAIENGNMVEAQRMVDEAAEKAGYNPIAYQNEGDGNIYGYHSNYKNDRKLLDTITYDDKGNVIPLSKRFNFRRSDVRYRDDENGNDDKKLYGVHNLTEENLLHAVKMGGLANPSTAVVRIDRDGLNSFGDISLLMPPSMIEKKSGRNAGTWSADAYSPRYPRNAVRGDMSSKGQDKFNKDIKTASDNEKMRREIRDGWSQYIIHNDKRDALYYWYLEDKGLTPEKVMEKPVELKSLDKAMIDATGGKEWTELTTEDKDKLRLCYADNIMSVIEPAFRDMLEKGDITEEEYKEKIVKFRKEEADGIKESGLFNLYGNAYARFKRSKKELGVDSYYTAFNARKRVQDEGLEKDFNDWLDGKKQEYEVTESVFDGFDSEGYRKYRPHTLANISRMMKKSGKAGAEELFTTSPGALRAKIAPIYGKLDDIRKNKDRIISSDEFEKIKEQISEEFFDLSALVRGKMGGDEGFYRLEEAMKHGAEWLNKNYSDIDLDKEDIERIEAFRTFLKEAPTEYFETKFERPVMLNEFVGAVVPKTMGDKARKALEEAGLKLYDYDPDIEGDRQKVTIEATEAENIRFRDDDTENAPLTDKERKLRDHLIHTIRRAGIDVITDVEQGQRVLDMMNGTEDVRFMGSKVEKRKQRVAAELKGKNLSEQQTAVVNVFTGNADNLPLTVNRDGKDITIVMRQGNEIGAGTKHSLYRHYDTTTGVITADDILRIPDVLANGERKPVMRGKTRLFEYSLKDADNTVFRVLTEMNNRFDETFADFYTNRKASSTARKTHSEEAQADIDNALSGAKVGNNSESAKLHKVFHGSGADFNAFDHSHMGEGEGAQAYGWGTYVTEVEGIGKTYAKSAARKPEGARPVQYKGEDFTQTSQEGWSQEKKDSFADIIEQMVSMGDNASEAIDHVFEDYERHLSQYKSLTAYDKEAIENLQNSINYLQRMTDEEFNERNKDGKWEVTNDTFERILVYDFHLGRNGMLAACENELERKREHLKLGEKFIERNKKRLEALDDFDEKDFTRVSYQPMLYTVDIPDDNGTNYLDYREPTDDTTMERIFDTLVKQGWKYREIVQVDKIPTYRFEKDDNFFYIERFEPVGNMLDILGDESSLGSDKAASKLFHDAGFVGIKYPAEYRSGGREDNAKNYVIFDENDAKIVDKVKFFRTDNGQAFGFTAGGKIYIDPHIATTETPIHEYGHLWTDALRKVNPEAWNHLKEQMETRKDIMDVVRKMYPELKGDELLEEMFQHFAGKQGAERLRAEQARLEAEAPTTDEKTIINRTFDSIRQMLSDFWQQIRNLLIGTNNKISDLTPEDFADMALSDLLGGENPTDPDRTTRFRDEEDSNKVKAPEREKGESIFDYAERIDKWHKEHAAIAQTEAQTDTNPTDGQKEAGNYRKGKFTIDSMTISVENPKGSTRSGVDANGKKWSVTMNNTYGYILGTEGVDGDHIDVFLSDDPTAGRVFVIDQVNDDGSFDEHKVMYGFGSEEEAKKAYLSNYSKGWKGLGKITEVSKEDFKKWISSSHRKTKPFAEYKMVGASNKSDTRFSFTGEEGAITADRLEGTKIRQDYLKKAEEMEKDGKTERMIKLATGWERGADGKWRYEIDDDVKSIEANLTTFERDVLNRLRTLQKEEEEAYKKFIFLEGRIPDRITKKYTDEEKARFREMRKVRDKYWKEYVSLGNRISDFKNKRSSGYILSDIYGEDHKLFKYYPELANLKVQLLDEKQMGAYLGLYDGRSIKLSNNHSYESTARTLLHEVQHAIQEKEGFASGGNPEAAKRFSTELGKKADVWEYSLACDEVAKEYNITSPYDIERKIFDNLGIKNAEDVKKAEDDGWIPDKEGRDKGYNLWARGYDGEGYEDAYNEYVKKLRESGTTSYWNDSPGNLYERLAGEVEARNTANIIRSRMSESQRRRTLATKTEDTPRKMQILMNKYGARFRDEEESYETAYKDKDKEKAFDIVREAAAKTFPDTKVVDKDGKPLVVYHGTQLMEMYFKDGHPYTKYTDRFNTFMEGKGFFTDDKDAAKSFARGKQGLYEAYLDIKNPFILDCKGHDWDMIEDYENKDGYKYVTTDYIVNDIKRNHPEYDGVILRNVMSENSGSVKHPIDDYIPFKPEQIKSAEPFTYDDSGKLISLSERFNPSNGDIRFRWIGEEGAEREDRSEGSTDRMDGLKVAKRMAKRNKTDKSIKLATGWERGADGKWRYEEGSINFNDEAIQKLPTKEYVDNMPITDIIDDDELVAAYPMLKYVTFSNKPNGNGLLGFYRYSDRHLNVDMTELLGEKMHLAKLEKKLAEKKKIAARDFDEDFLRNSEEWEIDIEEEVKKAAEEDIPFLERVVANTKEMLAFEYNKCKEVLNHEIQHFIQQQEKWAEGGSPKTVRKYLTDIRSVGGQPWQEREWVETHSDIVGVKYDLDRAMTLFRNPKRFLRMGDHFKYSGSHKELIAKGQKLAVDGYWNAIDHLERYADKYDLDLKDYGIDVEELESKVHSLRDKGYTFEDIAKRGIAAQQMKKFYADVERLSAKDAKGAHEIVENYDKISSDLIKLLDRELYTRLAGEVEARNASNRMDYTKEERRNSLASETEDVPRHDQIVNVPNELRTRYGSRFRDDEENTADERPSDRIGGSWKVGKNGRLTWEEDKVEPTVRKDRTAKTIGGRAQALLNEGTSSWQEQVKLMLAGTKMRGEDRESGTKGLISHTTGNRKDVANWCAKKGDIDALTPEELAEKIQAELPEGIRENVSDQDVFNEIIDTVMSYNTHKALIDDLERIKFEAETEGLTEYEKEQADAYAREKGFDSWDEYTSYEGYVEAEGERILKEARDKYLRRLGYDGEEGYLQEMNRLNRIQRAEARKRRQKEIKEELLAMVHQVEQRPIVPVRKKGESVFDYAERVGAYQKAQRQYDEEHPVETMSRDDAMRAVRDLVNEQLDRDSVSEIDKRTLNSILRTLSSTNVTNLESRLEEAKRLVNRIKVRANQNDIQKLLDLKVKDVNGKNMNVAKNVDDDTRRIMERLKGSVLDVQDSGLEDRIHDLRSENWRLRETLRNKDAEEDTQSIIDRIEENNKKIESLNEERKRILDKKARSADMNVDKAIETIQQKIDRDADNGEADQNDIIDLTALTLQKLILDGTMEDRNVIEMENKLAAVRRAKRMLYGKYEARLKEAKQAVDDEPSHDNLMRWQEVSKEYAEQRDRLLNMENGLNRIVNEAQANKMDIQEVLYEQLRNVVAGGKDNLKATLENQQQRRIAIIRDCFDDITGSGERAKPSDIDNENNTREKWYKSFFTSALSSFEYMAQNIATKSLGKDGKFYRQFVTGKDGVISANNTYIEGMRSARERLNEKVAEIFRDWKPETRTRKRDKLGRFVWNGLRGDGKDLDKIETFADWWQVMDMQPVEGEWGRNHNVSIDNRPATTGVTVLDMTDLDEQGKPTGSRYEIKDMSKGQATYIYQLWKMNDGRGKLETMGFDDESMEQIADYIGYDNIRMADWIQDEFLQEMREKYNSRYKEIYNTSMAAIDNYVPIKVNKGEIMEKIDLTGDTGNGAGKLVVKTGALINRTANDKSIDRSWSAAHVLWDHLDKMEEFYAFSPVRRDLSWVLGSQFFRNQLNKNSKGAFKRLVDAAEVAVHAERDNGGNEMDKVFATIQKGLVGGNIAFRNNTALKQMLSAPAFLGYSQDPEYLASLAYNTAKIYIGNSKALATVMATFGAKGKDIFENTAKGEGNFLTRMTDDVKWCLENVPDFYERVLKGSAGDSRLDEKGMENVIGRFIDKYMEQGMRSNQTVDALTCAIGIRTIYDYKMKKAQRRIDADVRRLPEDMSEEDISKWRKNEMEEAHRQAIMEATIYYNGTQQSNHKAFLSPLQVSRGFLQRAVSLYQNASIGFARRFVNACLDLNRMRNWKELSNSYTTRSLEEKGYKKTDIVPDDVKKETEIEVNKYLHNEMRKRLVEVGLYGFVTNFIWDMGGKGFLGLFRNKEEEEEGKDVWDNITYLATLPARGTTGMNTITGVLSGQRPEIGLHTSEIGKFIDNYKKAQEEYGIVSPEVAYVVLERMSRFAGVDLNTWTNTYLGVERMVRDGYRLFDDTDPSGKADMIVDLMLSLQSPESQRAAVAKKLYTEKYRDMYDTDEEFRAHLGECIDSYVEDVTRAMKYVQEGDTWESWLPSTKILKEQQMNSLRKEFIERNLTEEEKQQYEDFKAFKKTVKSLPDLASAQKLFRTTKEEGRREMIISKMRTLARQDEEDKGIEDEIAEMLGVKGTDKEDWKKVYIEEENENDAFEDIRLAQKIKEMKVVSDKLNRIKDDDKAYKFEEEHEEELDRYWNLCDIVADMREQKQTLGDSNLSDSERKEIWKIIRALRRKVLQF